MFDECRFEPGIRMGKYSRDLPIRPVSNEEIMWNSACNLAIILNIPNLKSENSKKIHKIQKLFFVSFLLFIWICKKCNSWE